MAKKKKISPLSKTLLETADDMRKAGLMDKASTRRSPCGIWGRKACPRRVRSRGRKSGPCANGLN
jgi:hypothetical protein